MIPGLTRSLEVYMLATRRQEVASWAIAWALFIAAAVGFYRYDGPGWLDKHAWHVK